ncbi:hypothetical protein K9L67_01435 [Candidatus Woesearchaeota archaeon]|nr:hypothetical protein [Candidatus Woesearchaeota archaeon]MCF7900866.1 hypothetical protein [Candidatus Woesearchaeota archaeon]MCF8013881.1 hypothetical protein [Candidatus Woesearchaeota archaeon]
MLTEKEILNLFEKLDLLRDNLEEIIKRKNFVKEKRKKIIKTLKKEYDQELAEQLLLLTQREIKIINDSNNIIKKLKEISKQIPEIPNFKTIKKILMTIGFFSKTIEELTTKTEYTLRFSAKTIDEMLTKTKTNLEDIKEILKEEETLIKPILENTNNQKEMIKYLKNMITAEKNIKNINIDIKKKMVKTFNKLGNFQTSMIIRSFFLPLSWILVLKGTIEGAELVENTTMSHMYGNIKDGLILSYVLLRYYDIPEKIVEKIKETYKTIKTPKDLKKIMMEREQIYEKYPELITLETTKY